MPTVWPSNFLMEPFNSSLVSNNRGEEADWCSTLRGQITEAYWKARSNCPLIATCLRDLPVSNWNVVINFLRRSDVTCCLCKGQENRGGLGRSWRGGGEFSYGVHSWCLSSGLICWVEMMCSAGHSPSFSDQQPAMFVAADNITAILILRIWLKI